MSAPAELRREVAALVVRHLDADPDRRLRSDRLPLAVPSFGSAEVAEAVQVLLSGHITMGARVAAFENAWASWVGASHGVMTNSGSSALAVMLAALVQTGRLARGDEVIVPAVAWSTSLFSVLSAGLRAVLVDVDPDTLVLRGRFDRPVLAVHLMGQPCEVEAPLVVEDACAAAGAKVGGRMAGALGVAGAFSFYFSHHVTTGEGGMITTSDRELADACRSIRAHGWARDRSDRERLERLHPEVDPRFLFVTPGTNARPTEIQGAFGVHQARRVERFVRIRNANHRAWCEIVEERRLPLRVFPQVPGTRHAAFGFAMLLDEDAPVGRAELCRRLEARGIETRPISGSNLARQPAVRDLPGVRVEGPLPVADAVHERGFFVGQSHAFGPEHGEFLARSLADILAG